MESKSKSSLYESIKPNQLFGKWTTTDKSIKRGSSHYVLCICECGLKKQVLAYDLLRKKSLQCTSCRATKNNLQHGQNQHGQITYEYRLWQQMKTKKNLCDSWHNSFIIFFNSIGKQPNPILKLLRKNSSHKFSLNNFYWGHPRDKFFRDFENMKIGKWTVLERDYLKKKFLGFANVNVDGKVTFLNQI